MKKIDFFFFVLVFVSACSEEPAEITPNETVSVEITDESVEEVRGFSNEVPSMEVFSQLDVAYDTNYVRENTAGLKVDLLMKNYYLDLEGDFGPWQKVDEQEPNCDFGETLFYDFFVCDCGDGKVQIANHIFINDSVAFLKDERHQCDVNRKLVTSFFGNWHDKGYFKSATGQLEIEGVGMHCNDTGLNHVVFRTEKGITDLGILNNVLVFEIDLDENGEKEVYIMSYITCAGFMEIYRVQK